MITKNSLARPLDLLLQIEGYRRALKTIEERRRKRKRGKDRGKEKGKIKREEQNKKEEKTKR